MKMAFFNAVFLFLSILLAPSYSVLQQPHSALYRYVSKSLSEIRLDPTLLSSIVVPDDVMADNIRNLSRSAFEFWNVTGMAVGVIKSLSAVPFVIENYGFADSAKALSVTSKSLFQIASCSKAFTSLLILLLQQDGLLNIDLPVINYLPDFKLRTEGSETLTLRDLMSHRTGLPRHDFMIFGNMTRTGIVRILKFLDVEMPIRYAAEYNNLMFVVAGVVAERVTGMSWEDLITSRILVPLNMTRSWPFFGLIPSSGIPCCSVALFITREEGVVLFCHILLSEADNIAQPYTNRILVERMLMLQLGPAGNIVSNMNDLLKWVRYLLLESQGQHILLKPMLASEFLKPNIPFQIINRFDTYSIGWWLQVFSTALLVHHGGNINGMTTEIAFIPGLNHAIVVMINENGSHAPEALMLNILTALLGMPYVNYNAVFAAAAVQQEAAAKIAASSLAQRMADPAAQAFRYPLSSYVAQYGHPAYGIIDIQMGFDGNLSAVFHLLNNTLSATVFHWYYETFAFEIRLFGVFVLPITFQSDDIGRVVGLTAPIEHNIAPIYFSNANFTNAAQGFAWPAANVQKYPDWTPCSGNVVVPSTTTGDVTLSSSAMALLVSLTAVASTLMMALLACGVYRCIGLKVPHAQNLQEDSQPNYVAI